LRFFKRETKLQTLERQSAAVNAQIQKLKAELQALSDAQHIDPVLKLWLQKRYGFNYAEERAIYEKIVNEKQALICELEKEKKKLEPQLEEEAFQQKLKDKQITFSGSDVKNFKGSVVTVKCHACGCIFDLDVRNRGSFANLLQAENENELKLLYNRKNNNVWPENCPNCGSPLDIWFWRGKI